MNNKKVAVLTVGFDEEYQRELATRLHGYQEIDIKHIDAWTFTVSSADILILNVDSDAGQETISMLRSFRGPNDPIVVTFSETDDRMHSWRSSGADAEKTAEDMVPGFCKRLEAALQKSGCINSHIEAFSEKRSQLLEEDGPSESDSTGMRWLG